METSDEHWMSLALAEARRGIGRTAPNPPVGAVIVKDGELFGSGWHRAAGKPHAEREALADAVAKHGADAVRGATAYVTLEPCSTHGRTPPCTAGLIEAGIARVVYACVDRNPDHAGRADTVLTNAGIAVSSGVLADEAETILRSFFKVRETGLPWVIWKTAMSLDGRLTRPPGEGQWLTGEAARADVQLLRSSIDAILTTGETVRRDKPALTIRRADLLEGRSQPWRVVFTDAPETLPRDAPLFTDEWRDRTLLRPRADPAETLRGLARDQGVLSCMTEAGGVFSAALVEAGLIDEVVVYLAPLLCGGPVPALAGAGLPEALRLGAAEFERFGDDVRIRARVMRSAGKMS
ncbi:MAG: bifunctional diaminohydroxyphosphoribosylaminopyrimidine deaminase/5-amino-6-(5-phosphoribosylamino)uracil reductase RibD [Akkermansiaceae bacterium]|nr:bifunctional diaminohydroxyphosphoribosylaminopyrimidine deaminase/5-amino-6-(5-phosphoribosylamino)uracil reductase RibD [Akkermansiaceae bacterium]MCP5545269.1 bifunctional diaminohydroxyphosphoribosylaminopyrimidine deaminase/5-amino-6-(5-phosphoribosylamino)uracil reductase RibD [Akkermansiaceae bacterium]